jgi:hypothetical protein
MNIIQRLKDLVINKAKAVGNNIPTLPKPTQGERYNLFDPNSSVGQAIRGRSNENGIAARLLAAILQTESSGDPYATREVNPTDTSYGLPQITPDTLETMRYRGSPKDMYDPNLGIQWGGMAAKNALKAVPPMNPQASWVPEFLASRVYSKYNNGLNSPYIQNSKTKRFDEIYSRMKELYK